MAIVKKSAGHPPEFDDLLIAGFTYQQLESIYGEKFKDIKGDVEKYLKESEDIVVTEGEGFETPYGMLIYTGRTTVKYNNAAIFKLVSDGKVTLDEVIACVSGFDAKKIKDLLSAADFKTVTTSSESKSLSFRATAEFKDKVRSDIESFEYDGFSTDGHADIEDAPKVSAASFSDDLKKTPAKGAAAEKARAAKAKVSAAKPDTDNELDAILKPKKAKARK